MSQNKGFLFFFYKAYSDIWAIFAPHTHTHPKFLIGGAKGVIGVEVMLQKTVFLSSKNSGRCWPNRSSSAHPEMLELKKKKAVYEIHSLKVDGLK